MLQEVQFQFGLTVWPFIILLVALVAVGAQRIKERRPELLKKYIAAVVVLGLVVPLTFVIVITLPPPRNVELDVGLTYKSNSTSHEYSVLYHWDASSAYRDAYGTHLKWRQTIAETASNNTGAFAEMMKQYTSDIYIQWTEIMVYSNATWTLRVDFPIPVDWTLYFRGDNTTAKGVQPLVTDAWPIFQDFQGALESYGIEGLMIYANISLKISADVLRSFYTLNSANVSTASPIDFIVRNIYVGTIPENPSTL